ncbi:MAG: Fic family protein, partial [Verrucomicrobia bacterium]|nr:Fic family protein [Verrucomicrobiota bacterium]
MTTFEALLQRVDSAKAQLDSMRPLDREREARVMQKFRLWWTYHSNAIEGNSLTQGETEMFLMEGLTAKGKPLKDHLDLRGHSNAINYLLGFIRDKEVLTEAAIRELHKILLVE